MDAAIATATSGPRIGYFRVGVYNDQWDRLVNALESAFGSLLFDMTRRELSLGSQNSTTGYYAATYTDKTITGLMIEKGNTKLQLAAGSFVNYDATLLTADVVLVSDQIKTQENVYFEVMSVTEKSVGDSFLYRECDLAKIPLYEE